MSTLEMVSKTTPPSINLLNHHSNSFHETTIVIAVSLAFIILALAIFIGILLLWKVQCKRCSHRQSEEDPQQFTEVYVGDFQPHTISGDDDTPGASGYVNMAAVSVHSSQINCTMTDKSNDSHITTRGKLQHNNLNDEISDNLIYQEVESNNVYSEARSFDGDPEDGSLNIDPEAGSLNVDPEAGSFNVYPKSGPFNVDPEDGPLNVYPKSGPFNVYPEDGPLNVYTESGSLNVYSDVEPHGLQHDVEPSNVHPYDNIDGYSEARIADIDGYSEARIADIEDADSLTTDSDNNDDRGNIYVNSNKTMESSSSESGPFPETAGDCEDPSTSVYDVPPNNSLYRTSFA